MSFPTSGSREYLDRFRLSGITVELYPSTVQGLLVELQGATANSTASSVWVSQILGPTTGGLLRYNWPVGYSTKTYYFKARHPTQPGYSAGPFSRTISATPQNFPLRRPFTFVDPRFSHGFAGQGSMLPYTTPSSFFTYNSGGPGSPVGKGWISFTWTAQTLYLPDGGTMSCPAPVTALAAPTVTEVAGGALPIRTRFVRIAYVKRENASGTSFESLLATSAETSFTTSAANKLLKVTSPANPGGGLYDGWCVLVGSTASQNYVQDDPCLIAFGTDWTEPVGGFSTTQNSRYTPSWGSMTFISLLDSTEHLFYPYYAITENRVRIPVLDSLHSSLCAQIQNGDGALSLGSYGSADGYTGVISITTPASGGTGSGTKGGGRLI